MLNEESDIIFERLSGCNGDIGSIILNRPKSLNALTGDMCKSLREKLIEWQRDDALKAVVIRGAGDRAFCAGGDIRTLYDNGVKNVEKSLAFFQLEYSMNSTLHHFTKPYVSLLDGITMGGGAGVSLHGSHRVATEKFLFAMPETGIGFFPDIGAGYFLNKCPSRLGFYLGLTGVRIKAGDAKALGLVTHIVAHGDGDVLVQALCDADLSENAFDKVSETIERFAMQCAPSSLVEEQDEISAAFSQQNMEAIFASLNLLDTKWSAETLATLKSKSPLSLKVTLEQLQRAENLSFDEVMQMEFWMAKQFMHTDDFYEGVRAALVDKDRNPVWQPSSLSEVMQAQVDPFFK